MFLSANFKDHKRKKYSVESKWDEEIPLPPFYTLKLFTGMHMQTIEYDWVLPWQMR